MTYGMKRTVMKSKARGVRLTDVLWQLLPAVTLLAVFAAVGVMHVGSRVQVVDSGYHLSELEGQNRALALSNDRLKLELATLKSPARLEKLAREQLGLQPPPPGAVLTVGPPPSLARRALAGPLPGGPPVRAARLVAERGL